MTCPGDARRRCCNSHHYPSFQNHPAFAMCQMYIWALGSRHLGWIQRQMTPIEEREMYREWNVSNKPVPHNGSPGEDSLTPFCKRKEEGAFGLKLEGGLHWMEKKWRAIPGQRNSMPRPWRWDRSWRDFKVSGISQDQLAKEPHRPCSGRETSLEANNRHTSIRGIKWEWQDQI